VSETGSSSFSGSAKRYEVQFQDGGQRHSDTNNLEQAKYFAQSLANWNLAAQVYDRATLRIIFRARAYAEKRRNDSIGNPRGESKYITKEDL
jgi:hypothetical protein